MTLREYRRVNGMTLDQMAVLLGRTPATVSRIERGVHRPGWDTLERIEEVTKGAVTVADIRSTEAA